MDVALRELRTPADCHAAADLFTALWGTEIVPGELMVAMAGSGNYVAGAWDGDRLVGAIMGWYGRRGGHEHLHSHIAGVRPDVQGAGIGYGLKQHQRSWAIERGIAEIRWTFDPLVRRNARFNLNRLGAVGVRFVEDYYGVLDDAVNANEPTDRMVVSWDLAPKGAVPSTPGDEVLVPLPDDIVTLRREAPAEAHRLRRELRAALTPAFEEGYRAVSVDDDGRLVLRPR